MPSYSIKCPYCGTIRSLPQNTEFTCKCKAVIFIGNDGNIKRSKPPKK